MTNVHIILDQSKRAKYCREMLRTLAHKSGKKIKSITMDLIEEEFTKKFGKKAFLELANGS